MDVGLRKIADIGYPLVMKHFLLEHQKVARWYFPFEAKNSLISQTAMFGYRASSAQTRMISNQNKAEENLPARWTSSEFSQKKQRLAHPLQNGGCSWNFCEIVGRPGRPGIFAAYGMIMDDHSPGFKPLAKYMKDSTLCPLDCAHLYTIINIY